MHVGQRQRTARYVGRAALLAVTLSIAAPVCAADITIRMSRSTGGSQGNAGSYLSGTGISADGRFVAFTSLATNLVRGDTNGAADVFVRDRETARPSA